MIVSFSQYHADPGGSGRLGLSLTRYMDAPVVEKKLPGRGRYTAIRDPAPEILLGHGDLLRLSIQSAPFQRRYRSGVLSFAPKRHRCARVQ